MAGVLIKCPQERERYTGGGWPREDGGRDKSDAATSQGAPGAAVRPKEPGEARNILRQSFQKNPALPAPCLWPFWPPELGEVMVALGDEYPLFWFHTYICWLQSPALGQTGHNASLSTFLPAFMTSPVVLSVKLSNGCYVIFSIIAIVESYQKGRIEGKLWEDSHAFLKWGGFGVWQHWRMEVPVHSTVSGVGEIVLHFLMWCLSSGIFGSACVKKSLLYI